MRSATPCGMRSTLGSFFRRTTTHLSHRGMTAPLLEIENLRTWFYTDSGVARSVDGVSLHVDHGETLGVVGESGCGKSVTALSILRLIRAPGRIEAGSAIRFEGKDLLTLAERDIQHVRGHRLLEHHRDPIAAHMLNVALS